MIWQLGVAIAGNWVGQRQLSLFVGNFSTMLARSTAKSNSEEWPTRRSTICWSVGSWDGFPVLAHNKIFSSEYFYCGTAKYFWAASNYFYQICCWLCHNNHINCQIFYQTKILKSLLYICFYFWRCWIKNNFTIDPANRK